MRQGLSVTLLALALVLGLAACGQLPRPFQPDGKSVDLRALYERETILVGALTGDRPGGEAALRAALAEALAAEGLTASTEPRAGWRGRRLSGRARLTHSGDGWEEVIVTWRLRGPDGALLAEHSQRVALAQGAWAEGGAGVHDALAEAAAEALAREMLRPDQPPPAAPSRAHVVLTRIEGAPGDGAQSLPPALIDALKAAGVPVASVATERDLLLSGRVAITEPSNGTQTMRLTWTLSRSDGDELGRISQDGRIPAGSLDGAWGATAEAIAAGAADGIQQLLEQVAR